jgi:hypothetical protein
VDNPETQRTTVNVKNVDVDAWEIARKHAARNDESLGSVVSRALYQLGKTDLLEPKMASRASANLMGITTDRSTDDLPTLMQAAAALAAATGGSLKVVPGLTTLLTERIRRERGLPPIVKRAVRQNGEAVANLLSANGNPGGNPALSEPEPIPS